jgi:hypothetical protein
MFPTPTPPPHIDLIQQEPIWNPSIHLVSNCGPKNVTYVLLLHICNVETLKLHNM